MPPRNSYELHKPSERYIMHGDNRPPREKLAAYDHALENSRDSHVALIHVDVLLDLAVASPEAPQRDLQRASNRLDGILDDATMLLDDGFNNEVERESGTYLAACLRRAELPNWSQAARGERVVMDYETMLDGVDRAIEFVYRGSDEGLVTEFIPLLLFARAQRIHNVQQPIGRLSLTRENMRRFPTLHVNRSWDVGISNDNSPHIFANPKDRIQVKQGKSGSAQPYHNANILFLRASRHGFSNPISIIDSCLVEAGKSTQGLTAPLSSGELDAVTENIVRGIEKEKALLQTA